MRIIFKNGYYIVYDSKAVYIAGMNKLLRLAIKEFEELKRRNKCIMYTN